MSSGFYQINVTDGVTPELRARASRFRPERVNQFIADRAVQLTKRHLLALPHNKRGWTPVNFYPDAARGTSGQADATGATVRIAKLGFRQRFYGGPILPVNAKALAIPVAEEAYGKTPADFAGQLKLIVIKGKGAWLALSSFEARPKDKPKKGSRNQRQGPALKTMRERLQFLFRLCAGVDQDGNPNIIPTDAEYLQVAIEGTEEALF